MDRSKPVIRAAAIATLLFLAGCAGAPLEQDGAAAGNAAHAGTQQRPAGAAPPARTWPADARPAITSLATDMVGVPYRYGGTSPSEGFDCSGLVHYAYAHAGFNVPRNSEELFKAASKIPLERAAEGDLVFFQDQRKLSHVGIYLGDNLFVHAPSSGKTVRVSSLDSAYYQTHLVGVGRLIPD